MDQLTDIAAFVRVVEHGSFTAAADSLEVSKAVVSKYISRLEQRLGARLLHRTTRRLTLTEAGDALFRRSAAALTELGEAEQDVAQLAGAPRGRLRVTAPTYFGSVMLAPMIKDFRIRYPEISLDLNLDDRIVDLVKERFDMAIRISRMADSSLVSRRLAPCPQIVVGSPAYFRMRGVPKTPAALTEHDCLSYSLLRAPNEWCFRAPRGRLTTVTVKSSICCNNDFVLKQTALDSLGLGWFPRYFVEHELSDGRLVQVLQDYESPELAINAVYATRRNLLPKVRAFVDFLAERLSAKSQKTSRKPQSAA